MFFCEECGTKNSIEYSAVVSDQRTTIQCVCCEEILNIHGSSIAQVSSPHAKKKLKSKMVLKYREQTIEIDQKHTRATFGRRQDNDIMLDDYRVSKSHAFIIYLNGKYVLCDQSTNGTFVFLKGSKGLILKKDELQLQCNGVIGLGEIVNFDSPAAIHFSITA